MELPTFEFPTFAKRSSSLPPQSNSAPGVVSTAPKKDKLAPKPFGTAVSQFVGWRVGSEGPCYPTDREDYENFKVALHAGIQFGVGQEKKYLSGGNSIFWATTIRNGLRPVPAFADFKMDESGIASCGQYLRLPQLGRVIGRTSMTAILAAVDAAIPALNFCGMGTRGSLLGMASPLSAEYNSWQDFLWYTLLMRVTDPKVRVFVDQAMTAKVKDGAAYGIEPADLKKPAPVEGSVLFTTGLGPSGLRAFGKGWVPFIAGVESEKFFWGVSGVYPVGSHALGMLDVTAHHKHCLNWAGLVMYYKTGVVKVFHPELLARACVPGKKSVPNPLLDIGYDGMGMSTGDGSKQSDNRAIFDYSCAVHKEWPRRPFELLPLDGPRGTIDKPEEFKHKKKVVLHAWTTIGKWEGSGRKPAHHWNTRCVLCDNVWLADPYQVRDESLVNDKASSDPSALMPEDAPDLDAEQEDASDGVPDLDKEEGDGSSDSEEEPPTPENEKEKEPVRVPKKLVSKVPNPPFARATSTSSRSVEPPPPSTPFVLVMSRSMASLPWTEALTVFRTPVNSLSIGAGVPLEFEGKRGTAVLCKGQEPPGIYASPVPLPHTPVSFEWKDETKTSLSVVEPGTNKFLYHTKFANADLFLMGLGCGVPLRLVIEKKKKEVKVFVGGIAFKCSHGSVMSLLAAAYGAVMRRK